MKEDAELSITPEQNEGAKKDITHTVVAVDENDARRLFLIARNRLVDVNHWNKYSSPSVFQLTDSSGNELTRTAQTGDYFKINIKAPGSVEGNGYDWVFIEAVEDHSNSEGDEEHMAMRVRPASNPLNPDRTDVAHFFSEQATSSFVVRREGKEVTAAVFGRNESPNIATSNLIDKVRNTVVALTAIAGLSNIQWRSLVNGLLTVE